MSCCSDAEQNGSLGSHIAVQLGLKTSWYSDAEENGGLSYHSSKAREYRSTRAGKDLQPGLNSSSSGGSACLPDGLAGVGPLPPHQHCHCITPHALQVLHQPCLTHLCCLRSCLIAHVGTHAVWWLNGSQGNESPVYEEQPLTQGGDKLGKVACQRSHQCGQECKAR